jgi:flagellar basal-body rod protein FlgC
MLDRMFAAGDISASGLTAERMRMQVVANNIANANATHTASGEPYRRQRVSFAPATSSFASLLDGQASQMTGVRVTGISDDMSEFPMVHDPGHPDADPITGYVKLPNVKVMNEMIDLLTATRSYEANLKALQTFKDMQERTLSILQQLG